MSTDFWTSVEPTGFCWNWVGGKTPRGYGQKQHKGRVQMAHRIAYELLIEPIGPGMVIDHLCRNHSCVNPDHLEPVTQKVNVSRGYVGKYSPNHYLRNTDRCKRGHLFDDANTYRHGNKRHCRQCRKEARVSHV